MRNAITGIFIVAVCSLVVISLLFLAHHTAFEYVPIYGWGGYAYQMITAASGCAAFIITIRTIVSSTNKSSLAWLLPLASLPTWMGAFATAYNYRFAYYVSSKMSTPPMFFGLANGYHHALSYLMIGLAATFPPLMTIAIALYVHVARKR